MTTFSTVTGPVTNLTVGDNGLISVSVNDVSFFFATTLTESVDIGQRVKNIVWLSLIREAFVRQLNVTLTVTNFASVVGVQLGKPGFG